MKFSTLNKCLLTFFFHIASHSDQQKVICKKPFHGIYYALFRNDCRSHIGTPAGSHRGPVNKLHKPMEKKRCQMQEGWPKDIPADDLIVCSIVVNNFCVSGFCDPLTGGFLFVFLKKI